MLYHKEGQKLVITPHPGQWRAWQSDRRFVFMLAGTQSGKTSFGPWWLWREIERHGGGDYLAVTSTFDLFNLKMLPEMRAVFETALGVGRLWAGAGILEIKDPKTGRFQARSASDTMYARVILRSAASETGLESATAKAAWLDEVGQEAFSLQAWEAVLRRLSLFQGRVLGTTTLYTVGWLKQQVYDRWLAGDQDIDVVQFASTQNPLFPVYEFERAKRTLPAWKFAMFYEGLFAHPPGLIYDVYDEDVHVVPPFAIPPEWPRYVGLDPGAVNEWAVWVAEHPNKHVYYVYRETPLGNMTTAEKVEKMQSLAASENVVMYVGGAPSEIQYRTDFGSLGLHVLAPPFADVEAGIDRITALLKTKRLYIFDDMAGLRDELGTYSRKLDPRTQEVTDEIMNKHDYHRLDALRYAGTILDEHVDWSMITADSAENIWNDMMPSAAGEGWSGVNFR